MTQADANFESVIIEVPRQSLLELTEVLGDFATKHGGAIIAEVVPRKENGDIFTPGMVTMLDDTVQGRPVAAVTAKELQSFAIGTGRDEKFSHRLFSMFFMGGFSASQTARQEAVRNYVAHDGNLISGFQADKMPEFVARLNAPSANTGALRLPGIGETYITFLNEYCEAMLVNTSKPSE